MNDSQTTVGPNQTSRGADFDQSRPVSCACVSCVVTPVASIDTLGRKAHEKWLAEGDRKYSPFNKPWGELTPEQRQQVTRQARVVVDHLRSIGMPIPFIDEYMPPGPGDVRWTDPARG